jgi:hypothetical protein
MEIMQCWVLVRHRGYRDSAALGSGEAWRVWR